MKTPCPGCLRHDIFTGRVPWPWFEVQPTLKKGRLFGPHFRPWHDVRDTSAPYSPTTGGGRLKISRNIPGVRAESGFTPTFG